MLLLGYDIGSSSIKASLVDAEAGMLLASSVSPANELSINSPKPGWAEQNPETWWIHLKKATQKVLADNKVSKERIGAIGISYQMHGLVIVDEDKKVLRPAIIWCDGRAVDIGNDAYEKLGNDFCNEHFLNSPGNFTASKLRWVKENEPKIYKKVHKFMLPGDYIGMKLTGDICTSVSGLSEGILWDYKKHGLADSLMDFYELDHGFVPDVVSNFSNQGQVSKEAAEQLGIDPGVPVSYRAGDQPNNALSLNVLNPGEATATAGTSGVIYGVTDEPVYDEFSRVNTFVHVNHQKNKPRYGVLLCINGTGIQYSWLKNTVFENSLDYESMNQMAAQVPIGSEGITVMPFGNGPERSLKNKDVGAQIEGIQFNRHSKGHIIRAIQEGIACSLNHGLEIMNEMGLDFSKIRVGKANMFLSPVFTQAFTNITGIEVELYETNGAQGAAIGAGLGAEIFMDREEAFNSLIQAETHTPSQELQKPYTEVYNRWKSVLN